MYVVFSKIQYQLCRNRHFIDKSFLFSTKLPQIQILYLFTASALISELAQLSIKQTIILPHYNILYKTLYFLNQVTPNNMLEREIVDIWKKYPMTSQKNDISQLIKKHNCQNEQTTFINVSLLAEAICDVIHFMHFVVNVYI